MYDNRTTRRAVVGVVCLLVAGCAAMKRQFASRTLVLATDTTVGIKLSALEGKDQKLKIGYDRTEIAYVALRENEGGREAYSAYTGMYFHNKWAWPWHVLTNEQNRVRIIQVFGTGQAADALATGDNRGIAKTLLAGAGLDPQLADPKPQPAPR